MRLHRSLPKLILFLISFGVLIVTTEFLTREFILSDQTETVALANAAQKAQEKESLLLTFFDDAENTIKAIRASDVFNQFLHSPQTKNDFKQLALTVARSQKDIMKIRYIDNAGMEVVRIDRDEIGEPAEIVNGSKLQNKQHRYFYFDAIPRPADKVWFSSIDLNEDHGKVETPYKPTLRAVMPLSYKEEFNGILIINYFTQPLLDQFANNPLYHSILVDDEGGILLHYDRLRNWSRYSGKANIFSDIPNFSEIAKNDTYRSDKLFARKLGLPIEQELILILSLDKASQELQQTLNHKNLLYSSGITLAITVVFGFIFAGLLNRFFTDYTNRGDYIEKLMDLNLRINNLLLKNKIYMDMASDGIHVLDEDGNIIVFSHSFAEMLGYTEEEVANLNVRDWEAKLRPDEIAEAMASFGDQAQKLATQHKRKDGTIIDVEINAKWIKTADGKFFYASSRDITERIRMEQELHKLATTDELTQLPSRRIFMEQLSIEMERFHRKQSNAVSVIFLDLDHFKRINDTYGHAAGDKVLISVAAILKDEIRRVDTVGRLGGEEFGLILTGTTEEMSFHFTNRIRKRIEESPLAIENHIVYCTISMGITSITDKDTSIEEILERADKALYQAKHSGRNRVKIYIEEGNQS